MSMRCRGRVSGQFRVDLDRFSRNLIVVGWVIRVTLGRFLCAEARVSLANLWTDSGSLCVKSRSTRASLGYLRPSLEHFRATLGHLR